MERCSRAAAVESASFTFGAIRKVKVAVLVVAIADTVCTANALYWNVPYNPRSWISRNQEAGYGPRLFTHHIL